jgi:PleD family two-component response regulator
MRSPEAERRDHLGVDDRPVKRDSSGQISHYEGTIEDITERRRFQAHIVHQANFDALTGLANRAQLDDRLRQAIKHAEALVAV